MPVFYTQTSFAEVCYIFEAAEWLAIGQIPEFYASEKGTEARLSPFAHDDQFEPVSEPSVFLSEEQLSLAVPGMNFMEYEDALEVTYGQTAEQIVAHAKKIAEKFDDSDNPEIQDYVRKEVKEAEHGAKIARWLEQEMTPFVHRVDQARASIFLALSNGSLQANGYTLRLNEEKEYQYCEVIEIPKEAWLWDQVSWDNASTLVDGAEVIGAYVDTSELLHLFPLPNSQAVQVSGNRYGSTIVDNGQVAVEQGSTAPRRGRGRPSKGGGLAKTAVVNEYRRKLAAAELSQKKEANIQAMIEWAALILNESVGRSTMQRWIDQSTENAHKRQPNNQKAS